MSSHAMSCAAAEPTSIAGRRLREIASRLEDLVISTGEALVTTETVQRALTDAEGLLTTSGAE